MKSLKLFKGNWDGRNERAVVCSTKTKAMQLLGTSVTTMNNFFSHTLDSMTEDYRAVWESPGDVFARPLQARSGTNVWTRVKPRAENESTAAEPILKSTHGWVSRAEEPPASESAITRLGSVMMSVHALCPTDMPHPDRMRWMAEQFCAKAQLMPAAPSNASSVDAKAQVTSAVVPDFLRDDLVAIKLVDGAWRPSVRDHPDAVYGANDVHAAIARILAMPASSVEEAPASPSETPAADRLESASARPRPRMK